MALMQVDISLRGVQYALEGWFGEVMFTGKLNFSKITLLCHILMYTLHTSTPDVIVCLDGNMQHRQYTSIVGDLVLPPDKFSIFVPDSIVEGSKQHVLDCQKGNSISLSY